VAEVFVSASTAAIPAVEGPWRSSRPFILRAAAAHTTSYVATSHFRCADAEWFSLDFALVWVDSTSTEWYVEWSQDGTTFYRDTAVAVSGGVGTLAVSSNTIALGATTNWNDGPYRVRDAYARVQVKKTGGVGADTLAVLASLLVARGG